MIVVDTSVVVAYMNAAEARHSRVADWLDHVGDDLATTPLVAAEVDYLTTSRGGAEAVRAFWDDLESGAYLIDWWPAALGAAIRLARHYADLGAGLADASLVALAERHNTVEIATLDERHFRAMRPLKGGPAFRLLPMDA